MSKLLIDDNPLQVLPKLAEAIGLNEAIVVQQVHYWLNKSKNIHDGKKWVYNTYAEWKDKNFPFWSVQTIGNVFRSLENSEIIISSQIDAKTWDRKKWYTINYSELERIENQIIERLNIVRSIDTTLDNLPLTETTKETTKKGAKEKTAPRVPATIEEAIIYGQDIPEDLLGEEAQFKSDVDDAAWAICQGFEDAKPLAIAFMEERQLILACATKGEIGGHRKALRQMINAKPNPVKEEHVREGVKNMLAAGLTIKNLFSVIAASIEEADPPPEVVSNDAYEGDIL